MSTPAFHIYESSPIIAQFSHSQYHSSFVGHFPFLPSFPCVIPSYLLSFARREKRKANISCQISSFHIMSVRRKNPYALKRKYTRKTKEERPGSCVKIIFLYFVAASFTDAMVSCVCHHCDRLKYGSQYWIGQRGGLSIMGGYSLISVDVYDSE